jgi:sugar (pentulose or hexulose) kinase
MNILCFDISSGGISAAIVDSDLQLKRYGLAARHTADLSRSILEGVIFNFGYLLDIVQQSSGVRAASLVPSGNGSLDPLAAPILAAITGASVEMTERPGLMTPRGTAICGLRALGKAFLPSGPGL